MKYSKEATEYYKNKIRNCLLSDPGISCRQVCRELERENLKLSRNYVNRLFKEVLVDTGGLDLARQEAYDRLRKAIHGLQDLWNEVGRLRDKIAKTQTDLMKPDLFDEASKLKYDDEGDEFL